MQTLNTIKDIRRYFTAVSKDVEVRDLITCCGTVNIWDMYKLNTFYFNLLDENFTLPAQYSTDTKFDLEFGHMIKINGHLLYQPDKDKGITVKCSDVEVVGYSDFYREYLHTYDKCEELGWFDDANKKEIKWSTSPSIAIITSFSGIGRSDFTTLLEYGLDIFSKHFKREINKPNCEFLHASMAGKHTVPTITNALRQADELGFDLIIITRGGGSTESIWEFNKLELAEAIYETRTPILSAVGHERDITICDMVADIRASTPSHGAIMVAEMMLRT